VTLHFRTCGQGPPLVLVHGWGFDAGVWDEVAAALALEWRVYCPDLPGYGGSRGAPAPGDLAALGEALVSAVPARAVWLGWSLGGMACLQIAARWPAAVDRLIVVAANARFTKAADWPHAVDPAVLQGFACALETDCRGTLMRFVALQVQDSDRKLEVQRRLRQHLSEKDETPVETLRWGLEILQRADLRPSLARVRCPTLLVFGDRDPLAPLGAARAMSEGLPGAVLQVIQGAGHAPFLSHPVRFLAALRAFADV
jgi:pimeloyl-[acyl-carrier protein] methyl ester esterase